MDQNNRRKNASIKDYLPKKVQDKTLIQVRIDSELVDEVQKVMDKHDLKWTEVIIACLQKFRDDMKS